MPIASSSAICLSHATGSRPVQPAITAWSIDMVNGVGAPLSNTVKVMSYTDHVLHGGREFENAAVRPARCRQHEANRHLALAMRRQRDGAAVDHIDQGAVAQGAQVFDGKRLVVGYEIGDARWCVRRRRQYPR